MSLVLPRCALVFGFAAIGCGGDAARVRLAPIDHACGAPSGQRGIRIIAYAASREDRTSVGVGESVAIDDLPTDTEQLGVEIEIGGGVVGAAGKTAPFEFLALDDGTTLPVFLAPPNGMCPTVSPMTTPRSAPLLARAGEGALIVGGRDADGEWVASMEYYDARTATFEALTVPSLFVDAENTSGFAGMSLATLPDGRVVISGGVFNQMTLFDAETRRFTSAGSIEARAYHASIATRDDELLVVGGCAALADGACTGPPRLSSKLYPLEDAINPTVGPTARISRLGATLFDVGVNVDGAHELVLAGGAAYASGDEGKADRLTLGGDAVELTNVRAHAAQLDGGGVLTAFAPDAAAASGLASVIVPGVAAARSIAKAPDLAGVRLLGLEDGRVLGLGGQAGSLAYDPTTDRWTSLPPSGASPALTAPSLLRLADGSVLVVDGSASADAWIYRPSLVGPTSGETTVLPLVDTNAVLTAEDPATVSRDFADPQTDYTLTAGATMARALIGGPRRSAGVVSASLRVHSGGFALIAQQQAPGRAVVGELVPGQPARIAVLGGSGGCSGREVPALPPLGTGAVVASNANGRLELADGVARLSLDGEVLASCPVDARGRGAWGVAAMPNSVVTVDTVTLQR